MNKILKVSLVVLTMFLVQQTASAQAKSPTSDTKPLVTQMSTELFKEKIFDFTKETTWKYKGKIPVIIDFYADWCRPCKMVAPIMEELAKKYEGKVLIYKVNTEKEELSSKFQIKSIPSILFIPIEGQPTMDIGAKSKEEYIKSIESLLLKEKK